MNAYEQRIEERRERLEAAAAKARRQAEAASGRAQSILDVIPMGQPVLVGHHSEARHRRDLARADNAMHQTAEALKRAEELEYKASRVGKGGISSDDPEAVDKLKAKLARLEALQDTMKRVNAQYRKGGWEAVEGLSEESIAKCKRVMLECPWIHAPFERWQLSNNLANIKRIRQRIEELEKRGPVGEGEEATTHEGEGFKLVENPELNRLQFIFNGKPAEDIRHTLKREGWRWAPSQGAWQRQLTDSARYSAERVVKFIETVQKFEG